MAYPQMFRHEYLNTTVPSSCKFKNVKFMNMWNLQNVNHVEVKAHTVFQEKLSAQVAIVYH